MYGNRTNFWRLLLSRTKVIKCSDRFAVDSWFSFWLAASTGLPGNEIYYLIGTEERSNFTGHFPLLFSKSPYRKHFLSGSPDSAKA